MHTIDRVDAVKRLPTEQREARNRLDEIEAVRRHMRDNVLSELCAVVEENMRAKHCKELVPLEAAVEAVFRRITVLRLHLDSLYDDRADYSGGFIIVYDEGRFRSLEKTIADEETQLAELEDHYAMLEDRCWNIIWF